jgi:hypothetical protein
MALKHATVVWQGEAIQRSMGDLAFRRGVPVEVYGAARIEYLRTSAGFLILEEADVPDASAPAPPVSTAAAEPAPPSPDASAPAPESGTILRQKATR